MNLIFAMERMASALSARMARTWGRGGASQSEAGGRPTSIQGETERAKKEEERREKEGSDENNNEEDQGEDEEGRKSTSSKELETEEPAKLPDKTQVLTGPTQEDIDEGKEGTADDDDDEPSPRNVEVHCKVHEKGGLSR